MAVFNRHRMISDSFSTCSHHFVDTGLLWTTLDTTDAYRNILKKYEKGHMIKKKQNPFAYMDTCLSCLSARWACKRVLSTVLQNVKSIWTLRQ